VSTVKPKRLRVRANADDDDDDNDENTHDDKTINTDDKENADAYSNAMTTALTSVSVMTSVDSIRPQSTRDRLEQLAARKRQDEQRRKVSNYLTNLTEAELPSFSSSFIVDDLGTGVLVDSQLEDNDEFPPCRRRRRKSRSCRSDRRDHGVDEHRHSVAAVWHRRQRRRRLWMCGRKQVSSAGLLRCGTRGAIV
jgi:hypothetical protein